jgi:hypothetical protein
VSGPERSRRRPFAALAVMGALAIGLAVGALMGSTASGSPGPAVTRYYPRATVTQTVTPVPPEPSPIPIVSGNG